MNFQTPILFLIFNRPDTTLRVFEKIKELKPQFLYIAADGPRNKSEKNSCEEARKVITLIDWDCEVKTLLREKNLGCGVAVSEGITWFFNHVEQGIIIEDDCLPDLSFFHFCEALLDKYKDDKRVWHISGNNFQNGIQRGEASFYFSMYNHIWGWASWRDRWQGYSLDISNQDITTDILFYTSNKRVLNYFNKQKKNILQSKINTWDFQYLFLMWRNKGLSILPNSNLVCNIGEGIQATNTSTNILKTVTGKIEKNLIFPKDVLQDKKADNYFSYNYLLFGYRKILKLLKNKIALVS